MINRLLLTFCFTSLVILPIYGDEFVQEIDNKTFVINITSINPIEIQNDDSKLTQILQEFVSNKDEISKGDLLIASSTVFAFFTFGSFFVTKFEGKRIEEELGLMDIILGSTLSIQIIHLFAIWSIVSGYIDVNYPNIILITVIFLIVIFLAVRKLFRLENRGKSTSKSTNSYLDSIIEQSVKDKTTQEDYFDLRRKYNKDLRESGY